MKLPFLNKKEKKEEVKSAFDNLTQIDEEKFEEEEIFYQKNKKYLSEINQFLDFTEQENINFSCISPANGNYSNSISIINTSFKRNQIEEYYKKYVDKGLFCIYLNPREKGKTKKEDIKFLRTIVIDIDPKKEYKTRYVSSDETKRKILKISEQIEKNLGAKGFKLGIKVDSGNGFHLYYKVKIPIHNTIEYARIQNYLRKFIEPIHKNFSKYQAEVDKQVTTDINRKIKVPGTFNFKNKQQAVNRRAKILFFNKKWEETIEDNTKIFLNTFSQTLEVKSKENDDQEKNINFENQNSMFKDFDEFNIQYKPLGVGVHENKYYFSIRGNNKKIFLVSSDKKMYCDDFSKKGKKEIQHEFGISYRHEFLHEIIEKRWSGKSVKKWMTNDISVDIRDLFIEIKELFVKYIDHPDERVIDYFVTDVICSYFMPLFQTKGRTVLFAPPSSGKTRTLTIFSLLCFNAKIMDKNASMSAMYRFIQTTSGTIIRDNMDRDGDSIKEFLDILETGYKKGTSTLKCTGRNFQLEVFETFSHVIYANISGLSDLTTISRCNLIELVKTENKEITLNEIDSEDEFWQETKDKLFIFAMNNWKEIAKNYKEFKDTNFYSRDLEKLKPNLMIAKLVDEDMCKDMIEYFKELEKNQKLIEFINNRLFSACEYIDSLFTENQKLPVKFKVKEISKSLLHKEVIRKDEEINTSQYIGKVFSNSSAYFQKGYSGSNVAYTITYENFKKFLKAHNFEKFFEKNTETTETTETNIDNIEEDYF